MTFTNLATTPIVNTGVSAALAAVDATNGNVVDTGRVLLHFKNTNASPAVVSISSPVTVQNMTVGPLVINVPATTGEVFVGPLDKAAFGQPVGSADAGRAHMTYTNASNLTCQVMSI
jgi:hypothetical protein